MSSEAVCAMQYLHQKSSSLNAFIPQSRHCVYGSRLQEQHLQLSMDLWQHFCVLGFSLFPLPQCNELFFRIVEIRFLWCLSEFLKKWHWWDLLWFYAEWWGGMSILRKLKLVSLKGGVISTVILMEVKLFGSLPL